MKTIIDMSTEEAIARLQNHFRIHNKQEKHSYYLQEAHRISIRAMREVESLRAAEAERSKAHKIVVKNDSDGYCPVCNLKLNTTFMDSNFCHWCGVKLTESDEDKDFVSQSGIDTFMTELRRLSEHYHISENHAGCYISNYNDSYICGAANANRPCRFSHICKAIHASEERANGTT